MRLDCAFGAGANPIVYQRSRKRADLERELLSAQKRADLCTPGSPSWAAAMGLVDDLEDEVRRLEQSADGRDVVSVGQSSS